MIAVQINVIIFPQVNLYTDKTLVCLRLDLVESLQPVALTRGGKLHNTA